MTNTNPTNKHAACDCLWETNDAGFFYLHWIEDSCRVHADTEEAIKYRWGMFDGVRDGLYQIEDVNCFLLPNHEFSFDRNTWEVGIGTYVDTQFPRIARMK